jgi:hypothetical protein
MSFKNSKELKITIHKDREPELYAWAVSLTYGAFPREMLKILNWLYLNEGLELGGTRELDEVFVRKSLNNLGGRNTEFEQSVLSELQAIKELVNQRPQQFHLEHEESKLEVVEGKDSGFKPEEDEDQQAAEVQPSVATPFMAFGQSTKTDVSDTLVTQNQPENHKDEDEGVQLNVAPLFSVFGAR